MDTRSAAMGILPLLLPRGAAGHVLRAHIPDRPGLRRAAADGRSHRETHGKG